MMENIGFLFFLLLYWCSENDELMLVAAILKNKGDEEYHLVGATGSNYGDIN